MNFDLKAQSTWETHLCPHTSEFVIFTDPENKVQFIMTSYRVNCPIAPGLVFSSQNLNENKMITQYASAGIAIATYERIIDRAIEEFNRMMIYKGPMLEG